MVGYRQTNQKTDTGKTLTRWPVFVDHFMPMATDRQCFHSLRGHFITCLDRAGVPEQRIGYITGHSSQAAATEAFKTYSAGCSMKELSDYVEMVAYPEITFPELNKEEQAPHA